MGGDTLEEDKYRYIIWDYKDWGSIVSDVYTSRIACEKAADDWLAGEPKGSTVEVVKVL